jgi:drug/metabolite transporter (DMT)-like permease
LAAATGEVWALSAFLAAARLQVATVLLLPLSLPLPALAARGWRYAVAAGLALALHFVSWIASLALTSIAASTALVTTHTNLSSVCTFTKEHDSHIEGVSGIAT